MSLSSCDLSLLSLSSCDLSLLSLSSCDLSLLSLSSCDLSLLSLSSSFPSCDLSLDALSVNGLSSWGLSLEALSVNGLSSWGLSLLVLDVVSSSGEVVFPIDISPLEQENASDLILPKVKTSFNPSLTTCCSNINDCSDNSPPKTQSISTFFLVDFLRVHLDS